jgi:hypothetical protein
MAVINWNSVPDYDQWGVDSFWNCEDWITWHKKLLEHFGQQTAKDLWDYAYAKSGNFSSNLDCRTFNSTFRAYVNKNGLSPYANAGVLAPVLSTYGTATDILGGTLSGVSSFFTGDKIKTIMNILLIGGVIYGGVYIYKSVKK